MAWHVAQLTRTGQMPELTVLTGERPRNRPAMTPETMLANLRQWKAVLAPRNGAPTNND